MGAEDVKRHRSTSTAIEAAAVPEVDSPSRLVAKPLATDVP